MRQLKQEGERFSFIETYYVLCVKLCQKYSHLTGGSTGTNTILIAKLCKAACKCRRNSERHQERLIRMFANSAKESASTTC